MAFQNPSTVVFSLIVPVRDEGESLESLHGQLTDEARKLGERYEIVYVDDGSSDQTVSLVERIAGHDEQVVVVELSGQFGSAAAVTAGATVAGGRATITFDRRCPHWPDLLTKLVKAWREGFEIVHVGGRARRPGALRQALSAIDRGDRVQMRLLDRAALMAIQPFDGTRSINQLISHVGFRPTRLPGESGAAAALQPESRRLLEAPGRLANWGLATAATLMIAAAGFYLVSLLLLLTGVNTGVESRMTAVIVALAGFQLGLLATVGRFIACATTRLSRRPIFAVRRILGPVEVDEPAADLQDDSEFGSYVVFT